MKGDVLMKKFVVTVLAIIGGFNVVKYIANEEKWQAPKLPEIKVRVIFGKEKESK